MVHYLHMRNSKEVGIHHKPLYNQISP